MKNVTIKDIAKVAGVTHATVSNVVNNKDNVKEETKVRIRKIMEDMNYTPDLTARALKTGRTFTVGIIIGQLGTEYTNEILRGIEEEISDTDYDMKLYPTRGVDKKSDEFYSRIFSAKREDALICNGWDWQRHKEMLKKLGIPVVLLEYNSKDHHSVMFDNVKSGYTSTQYLIDKGAKNIAFVIGDVEYVASQRERLEGYKKCLADNGLEYDDRYVTGIHNHSFDDGVTAMEILLEEKIKLDAINCAAGDAVALGIYRCATDNGISIPGDMMLMGHDNTEYARALNITTVNQPLVEMGAQALKLALSSIDNKAMRPVKIEMEPEIIVRRTA